MLVVVEAYFQDALKAALVSGTPIVTGPSAGPEGATTTLVEITASQLTFLPRKSAEGELPAERRPTFDSRVRRFDADGTGCDFVLPGEETGEVVEVQAPAGRLRTRGDDYQIQGRALRFYVPPAKGVGAVVARLRGAPVRGYQQTLSGQINLTIRVWAKERSRADELAQRILATALIAAAELGILDGTDPNTPAVSLRLLHAVTQLVAVRRSLTPQGTRFHIAELEFVLRGELEQTVALGAPEPVGIIREVRRAP